MRIDSLHQIAWSAKRCKATLDTTNAVTMMQDLRDALLSVDWTQESQTWPSVDQPIAFGVPVKNPPDPPIPEGDKPTVDVTSGAFIGVWDVEENEDRTHWNFFFFYDSTRAKPGSCSQSGFEGKGHWVEMGTTAADSLANLAQEITDHTRFTGGWYISGVGLNSQHVTLERKPDNLNAGLYNLDYLYSDPGTVGITAVFSGGGYVLEARASATNREYWIWLRGINTGAGVQCWCEVRGYAGGTADFPLGGEGMTPLPDTVCACPHQAVIQPNLVGNGYKLLVSAPWIKPGQGITHALVAANVFRTRMYWSPGTGEINQVAVALDGELAVLPSTYAPLKRPGIQMLRFQAGPLLSTTGKAQVCNAWLSLAEIVEGVLQESRIVGLPWDMLAATDKADYGATGAFDKKEFLLVTRQENDVNDENGGDASLWVATDGVGGENTWESPGRGADSGSGYSFAG